MNQQCKVCGEPAAGYHFGAFTCEGCKSFFGRTYNNATALTACKNGGKCVINKKNRTSCKACRLEKCISVGMSKSGSRYGRRSNWFKIHCLLQEQTNQNVAPSGTSPFSPNFLSAVLPPRQQDNAYVKEMKDLVSPSQEDLAIQSHLLQAAMLRHEREKQHSPHLDDVALRERRLIFAWQKLPTLRRQYMPLQSCDNPSRESSSSPFDRQQDMAISPTIAMNIVNQNDATRSMSEEYVQLLQQVDSVEKYKRYVDAISEASSIAGSCNGDDRLHDIELRSNSEHNHFKTIPDSPTLSERESSPGKMTNATLTLTAAYQRNLGQHNLGLMYPPPALITPAASHSSLAGGDLLLVSPSPGGLAVEQNEPIDLSVRTCRSSPLSNQLSKEENNEVDEDNDTHDDNPSKEEITSRSTPLDLTLTVKRPTEVSL